MRLLLCVSLLGLLGLLSVATPAVIEQIPQAQKQLRSIVAPKFERRVEGLHDGGANKRDGGEQWIFGTFNTDKGQCSNGCILREPKINGRPYPYCQNFPGSIPWHHPEAPLIKNATINPVTESKDGVSADSRYPQWICFFYNDYDCDPEKGGGPGLVQWGFIHDKGWKNGNPNDRTFEFSIRTSDDKKELWYHIKAYGCMLYVDAPEAPNSKGGQAEGGLMEGLMSHDLVEQLAAAQAISDGHIEGTSDATLRRP